MCTSYRFELEEDAAWRAHLSARGFAVVAGAMTKSEVASATALLWRDIDRVWPPEARADAVKAGGSGARCAHVVRAVRARAALEARPECAFSHDECLSYDADGTTCNVYDRWFQCTTPNTGTPPPPAYVCAGDLYCINGECTSVTREASTEFKDAMVAMNVMGELRDEFDPNQLKIFSGENLKCTKKVFGLSNCCSGKGVPLLTPWLCNSQDRDVDKKDDAGLCHHVGTYCSDKILGVCVTRKQSYCCYGSKLVRILNEQGKAVRGSTVLVLGVAYKPDVADLRESPALDILALLDEKGADVQYHDPHVPALQHNHMALTSVADLDAAGYAAFLTDNHHHHCIHLACTLHCSDS